MRCADDLWDRVRANRTDQIEAVEPYPPGGLGFVLSLVDLLLQFGPRRHADLVVTIGEGRKAGTVIRMHNAGQASAKDVRIQLSSRGESLTSDLNGPQPIPVIAPGHESTLILSTYMGGPERYDVLMSWTDRRFRRQKREHSLSDKFKRS